MVVPVVMVHGGGGNILDAEAPAMIEGLRRAVDRGFLILSSGGTSLDAAQACVEVLEDDPAFNAGKGSFLNSEGEVEMDALLMEGTHLNLGSVGAVRNVAHPVALARRVMENSRASMLVGAGADRFAREQGLGTVPSFKLLTDKSLKIYEMFAKDPEIAKGEFLGTGKMGTVGAVVVDRSGKVACAVSTGGTIGKPPGRLGDTSIPGSGGYADDKVGAVAATGRGECIMRVCLAHRILNAMEHGKSAQEATEAALDYMKSAVGDAAGAITVSSNGDVGIAFTCKRMAWGYKIGDGVVHAGVDKPLLS